MGFSRQLNNHSNILREPSDRIEVDVVVVGSGPGGSVAAAVLSRELNEVLIVEEGSLYPEVSSPAFDDREMVKKYRDSGMTLSIRDQIISYVEAECVGGGSEINSGFYGEVYGGIIDRWKNFYQVDIDHMDLTDYYKDIRNRLGVSFLPFKAPIASRVLLKGSEQLGWEASEVPRWVKYRSDGRIDQKTMTKTYLREALNNGAKLLPETRLTTINKQGDRWCLKGTRASETVSISANTVFVCCGATQTPALLQQNGLGSNVGTGFQLHPFVKIGALFDQEVQSDQLKVGVHQVNEYAPGLRFGCSVATPAHIAVNLANYPKKLSLLREQPKRFALFYVRLKGGAGSITSIPGSTSPLVNYSLSQEELTTLALGVKNLSRCLLAGGAKEVLPNISPGFSISESKEVEKLPGTLSPAKTVMTSVHLFSSCPMGENKDHSTVNSFGRLHGHDNIYLADGSILPTSPGVNPQATIMALAQRNAEQFLRGRL